MFLYVVFIDGIDMKMLWKLIWKWKCRRFSLHLSKLTVKVCKTVFVELWWICLILVVNEPVVILGVFLEFKEYLNDYLTWDGKHKSISLMRGEKGRLFRKKIPVILYEVGQSSVEQTWPSDRKGNIFVIIFY